MDLKLKEVAELLNVSEITIRRWLADGKIPAYRINHQYRFSRTEIENWIISHRLACCSEETKPVKTDNVKKFGLFRAISNGDVLVNVPGNSKQEVLHNASLKIGPIINCDPSRIEDMILQREELQSTALGNGFALPHARNFFLPTNQESVIVTFLEKAIDFESVDKMPVKTLFFLFAGDDKRHLNLLSKIANLCTDEKNQKFITSMPPKKIFLDYVKDWEDRVY